MKKIYSIFLVFLLGFVAFSCSDGDDLVYNDSNAVPSKLNGINSAYILNANSSDFATFTYSAADFGMSVSVIYSLETSLTSDFKSAKELASDSKAGALAVPADKMNAILLSWDINPGTPTSVYFRVKAYVQNLSSKPTAMVTYSNVITSTISAYSGEKEYPKVWVIGDYCGWSHANSQFLFCFEENDVKYQGVVDFADKAANGFKLTGIAGWDDTKNWGLDKDAAAPAAEASTLQLISSGGSANIACYSHRFYRFSFDKPTLVLTTDLSFDVLSIVGDAGSQVAGWGKAEVDMEFDKTKQRFWADVEFTNGVIKFRVNHDWAISFGSKTPGKLDGGDNINVTAGKYRVYVNMNNPKDLTYELSEKDFNK